MLSLSKWLVKSRLVNIVSKMTIARTNTVNPPTITTPQELFAWREMHNAQEPSVSKYSAHGDAG